MLAKAGEQLPRTSPPVVTKVSAPLQFAAAGGDGARHTLYLTHRDGQQRNLGPGIVEPGPGEVILPDYFLEGTGIRTEDRLTVEVPTPICLDQLGAAPVERAPPTQRTLTVVGAYPVIPTRPEPAFWCAQRAFFRQS